LIQHIQKGWGFLRGEFGEFVELWPAQQRIEASWYSGTADAVYQNLDIIRNHEPNFVLVLAGDHVYKMDYGPMIAAHVAQGADATVGCIEVPLDRATEFGVMTVSAANRVTGFLEKPSAPKPMPGRTDVALASMGIYVFNTTFLYEQLVRDAHTPKSSHDFGKDILPHIIDKYNVMAYSFRELDSNKQAYWRDVGTIDAFWEANMELIGVTPELNLYDDEWPIWTYQEQLPPAKFIFDDDGRRGMAVDSMVSGGDIISGSLVRHSLMFSKIRVADRCTIQHCVVLPNVTIGAGCQLNKVIIEEGCVVPAGTVIGGDPERDAARFYVSKGGVTVVTPEMLGQELHHAR
ncbi:MAG TPA: glucose-1-phosphate adenylyltransferase, partial [Burkholderiaceae bacterium]|nr:glucose-1-phosphate adenylyltransferase [Burkholderiaceae bacterium]